MLLKREGKYMNYLRILLAAVAATIAFFIYGFVVHGWLTAKGYIPYPEGVYRAGDAAQTRMPFALAGLFVAIIVFAAIYAKNCRTAGARSGASLGFLFGIFMAGAFVAFNYSTLNISGKLASELAISELFEWTLVGTVVGSIYRPSGIKQHT
jgi:magnesium-transporting ATPase (P-type)